MEVKSTSKLLAKGRFTLIFLVILIVEDPTVALNCTFMYLYFGLCLKCNVG